MYIYYTIKHEDSTFAIGVCSLGTIPEVNGKPIGTEISESKYNEFYTGHANGKSIYQDDSGELKLRDQYTKYDESTKQWIPDIDAIKEQKIQQLKMQAQHALSETVNYDMPSYRIRLTEEQNKFNDNYRAQLWDIIDGRYNGTELPINPNKKE